MSRAVSSNSLVSRLVLALAVLACVAMSHLNQGLVFEGSLDLFIAGIEERRQKEMGIAFAPPILRAESTLPAPNHMR
jgi:hypothetical protein